MRETPNNTDKAKELQSKAKKSQSYFGYLSQWGTTPIHDFAREHDALKNLPEVTKIWSFMGFEVASPKLRSFVKALIDSKENSKENSSDPAKTNLLAAAAIRLFPEDTLFPELKKAEDMLEISEVLLEGAKEELTKLKVLGANLEQEKAQAGKALEEAQEEVAAKEREVGAAKAVSERPFAPEKDKAKDKKAQSSLHAAEKKQNEAQGKLTDVDKRIDGFPVQIKSAKAEIIKQQGKVLESKENLEKVKSEVEGPNKAMLLAFLDGDLASFKKHFAAFEKAMCDQSSNEYALGLGSADDLYCMISKKNLTLTVENTKFLSGEKKSVLDNHDKASFLHLIELVKEAAEAYLISANDLNDTKNHQNKLDAFISKAAHIKKDKIIAILPELKTKVKEAKINNNTSVLQSIKDNFRYYGEGKYRIPYARDAIAYVKPWCQSFFVGLKEQNGKVGEALDLAQVKLKEAQDDLKHIRQAAGFFYGFTYTSALKCVLQKEFQDDSKMKTAFDGNMKTAFDGNMKKAIETKEIKPTLKTRVANLFGFKPAKDKGEIDATNGSGSAANSADFGAVDGEFPPATSVGRGSNRRGSAPTREV